MNSRREPDVGGLAVLRFSLALLANFQNTTVRGLFTLADLCPAFLPLRVRCPFARLVPFGFGSGPQANGIDATVCFLLVALIGDDANRPEVCQGIRQFPRPVRLR